MKPQITFSINIYYINESPVVRSNDMIQFAHRFVGSELSAVFEAILVYFRFLGRKEIFGATHYILAQSVLFLRGDVGISN